MDKTRWLIGSGRGCDIVEKSDPHMEPQHCEITSRTDAEDGRVRFYVRDLDTKAGTTYLMTACEPEEPGEVIVPSKTPRRIVVGDTIVIGWTRILWHGPNKWVKTTQSREFLLRPPAGWLNRIDEVLRYHGSTGLHTVYLSEALGALVRSWWDGYKSDGEPSPSYWGRRALDETRSAPQVPDVYDLDQVSGVTAAAVAVLGELRARLALICDAGDVPGTVVLVNMIDQYAREIVRTAQKAGADE
jgi:hypothetical protein